VPSLLTCFEHSKTGNIQVTDALPVLSWDMSVSPLTGYQAFINYGLDHSGLLPLTDPLTVQFTVDPSSTLDIVATVCSFSLFAELANFFYVYSSLPL
jgi:hypothetical protein